MTLFFTSDQHFYHNNVIQYCDRPFLSVEEMNEEIIRRFNERVTSTDATFHLGDFSLQSKYVPEILPKLNGIHYLAACGNHDRCFEAITKPHKEKQQVWIEFYRKAGFKNVGLSGNLYISSSWGHPSEVNYSHFPYRGAGDHSEKERFWSKRLEDDGKPLLHWHVHEKWKLNHTDKGTLMINVGVDVWDFYPVSEVQIAEIIKAEKYGYKLN